MRAFLGRERDVVQTRAVAAGTAVLTVDLDPATVRDKSAGPHNNVMDDRGIELYGHF
ncbi:hypothetical protein JNUCC0626_08250 [Lentzea sp. JNUCC 0626]|uniref:hypothetical protein n=1 Tax=Lentzea sp. JNUCC 0626 TaxID=3367513 RepID=UPI00374830F6